MLKAPGSARVAQAHAEAPPRGVRPLVGRARSKLMQVMRPVVETDARFRVQGSGFREASALKRSSLCSTG